MLQPVPNALLRAVTSSCHAAPKPHGAHLEVKNHGGHTCSGVSGWVTDFPCPRYEEETVASLGFFFFKLLHLHVIYPVYHPSNKYASENNGPVEYSNPNAGRRWSKTSHHPAGMGRASTRFLPLGKGMLQDQRKANALQRYHAAVPEPGKSSSPACAPARCVRTRQESRGQRQHWCLTHPLCRCPSGSSALAPTDEAQHSPVTSSPLFTLARSHSQPL